MNILITSSHLDDAELSCGGIISEAVAKNHKVFVAVLSDSEDYHHNGVVYRSNSQALEEGKNAADVLGIEMKSFNYSSKDVPFNSSVVAIIEDIIKDFKPDLIMTHWVHDTHVSHRNVGLSTIAAGRSHNSIIMYEPPSPSSNSYQPFKTQLYFQLSQDAINQKLDAIRCYTSQYLKYGKEEWIQTVLARNRYRGAECGARWAECFEIVRLCGGLII